MEKFKNIIGIVLVAVMCAYTVDGISQGQLIPAKKEAVVIKNSIDKSENQHVNKPVLSSENMSVKETAKRTTTEMNGSVNDTQASKSELGLVLVSSAKGALVEEVIPGSPAEKAGFKAGDVLYAVGEEFTKTPDAVTSAVGRSGNNLIINYMRGEKSASCRVQL